VNAEADHAVTPQLLALYRDAVENNAQEAWARLETLAACQTPHASLMLADAHGRARRFAQAITTIERAPELANHSGAWLVAGINHIHLGDMAAAYACLRRSLRIDWRNHDAHRMAWTALEGMGRLGEAASAVKQFLRDVPLPPRDAATRRALPHVTLCAIDCVQPALAERALRLSMQGLDFAAVKLLTSLNHRAAGIDAVTIRSLTSTPDYSAFVLRELPRYIDTDFVLLVQWDGYVMQPGAWRDEFLHYDYIGARWNAGQVKNLGPNGQYDVGNGGFSLRSRRFLDAIASLTRDVDTDDLHPEDAVACRYLRPHMEERFGIRYAPAHLAECFSFEHTPAAAPTFGFHGLINLAQALATPAFSRFDFLEHSA
jgi:tetratricopeptide (TPR) repeat protein